MATSRTIGPIHFEDLEPKRFEDLVRQLSYDFRNWRRLEATGRAGSDDGFDARGYEVVAFDAPEEDASEVEETQLSPDRPWLIQCKREKSISPKKLSTYLDEINLNESEPLHGLIFVAACDFSKKSRDAFRLKCEELGIQEWHLWGKAELEDQLFQPKNDNLLFAYFSISLSIRRRSRKSEITQLLAIKRRAHRTLSGVMRAHLLLRDTNDENYPNPPESHGEKPRWLTARLREFHARGLFFRSATISPISQETHFSGMQRSRSMTRRITTTTGALEKTSFRKEERYLSSGIRCRRGTGLGLKCWRLFRTKISWQSMS